MTASQDPSPGDTVGGAPVVDPGSDLLGSVYRVPDKWWGFQAVGRQDHPGACTGYCGASAQATLLKGTGLGTKSFDFQVVVEPSDTNGLSKATSFAIRPWSFSGRKVALLHFDRKIGELATGTLEQLQSELERVFG